jgi:hypothetical protein
MACNALVTYLYYSKTYMGEPIAEDEFPRAEAKAERIIGQITHGRTANYDKLPAVLQQAIQTAICAQVEYYAMMGTDVSVNGDTGGGGWTIGKMHINGSGSSASSATGAASMVCAAAIAALEQTGLMNPQVTTVGEPSMLPFWMIGGI